MCPSLGPGPSFFSINTVSLIGRIAEEYTHCTKMTSRQRLSLGQSQSSLTSPPLLVPQSQSIVQSQQQPLVQQQQPRQPANSTVKDDQKDLDDIAPEVFLVFLTSIIWIVACIACNGTNCRFYFPDVFHLVPVVIHAQRGIRFWILALIVTLSATGNAPCHTNHLYPYTLKTWVPMFVFLGIFVFVYSVYRGFFSIIQSRPRPKHVRFYEGFILLQTLTLSYSIIMEIPLANGWVPSPLFPLMAAMSLYLSGDDLPREPDDGMSLFLSIFILVGFILGVTGIASSFSIPSCLGFTPSYTLTGIHTFSEMGVCLTAFIAFWLEIERGCK